KNASLTQKSLNSLPLMMPAKLTLTDDVVCGGKLTVSDIIEFLRVTFSVDPSENASVAVPARFAFIQIDMFVPTPLIIVSLLTVLAETKSNCSQSPVPSPVLL